MPPERGHKLPQEQREAILLGRHETPIKFEHRQSGNGIVGEDRVRREAKHLANAGSRDGSECASRTCLKKPSRWSSGALRHSSNLAPQAVMRPLVVKDRITASRWAQQMTGVWLARTGRGGDRRPRPATRRECLVVSR